ncbi:MAG: S4 domain-containing protein [Oscillospiraceae bacterium]
MLQRLDKILSNSGRLTRSQARDALKAGRVAVYGETVRDGAAKFDPETAPVTLDGAPVAGGNGGAFAEQACRLCDRDPRFPIPYGDGSAAVCLPEAGGPGGKAG